MLEPVVVVNFSVSGRVSVTSTVAGSSPSTEVVAVRLASTHQLVEFEVMGVVALCSVEVEKSVENAVLSLAKTTVMFAAVEMASPAELVTTTWYAPASARVAEVIV